MPMSCSPGLATRRVRARAASQGAHRVLAFEAPSMKGPPWRCRRRQPRSFLRPTHSAACPAGGSRRIRRRWSATNSGCSTRSYQEHHSRRGWRRCRGCAPAPGGSRRRPATTSCSGTGKSRACTDQAPVSGRSGLTITSSGNSAAAMEPGTAPAPPSSCRWTRPGWRWIGPGSAGVSIIRRHAAVD